MSYTILYHPKVKGDLKLLDKKQKEIIARAIEDRLGEEPEKYAKPLRGSLKGYWKLRIGNFRVVFKIPGGEVLVLAILHLSRSLL